MKRFAIITYKHGISELPHELANYLRCFYPHGMLAARGALVLTQEKKYLRKLGNIKKILQFYRMIA